MAKSSKGAGSTKTHIWCSSPIWTGGCISLVKADLREYRISTVSTMPSYEKELSSQELADVVSYLLSLKGR